MALYIPHSIFHLAWLFYVRPETFGPHYVIHVARLIAVDSGYEIYSALFSTAFDSSGM